MTAQPDSAFAAAQGLVRWEGDRGEMQPTQHKGLQQVGFIPVGIEILISGF